MCVADVPALRALKILEDFGIPRSYDRGYFLPALRASCQKIYDATPLPEKP